MTGLCFDRRWSIIIFNLIIFFRNFSLFHNWWQYRTSTTNQFIPTASTFVQPLTETKVISKNLRSRPNDYFLVSVLLKNKTLCLLWFNIRREIADSHLSFVSNRFDRGFLFEEAEHWLTSIERVFSSTRHRSDFWLNLKGSSQHRTICRFETHRQTRSKSIFKDERFRWTLRYR